MWRVNGGRHLTTVSSRPPELAGLEDHANSETQPSTGGG